MSAVSITTDGSDTYSFNIGPTTNFPIIDLAHTMSPVVATISPGIHVVGLFAPTSAAVIAAMQAALLSVGVLYNGPVGGAGGPRVLSNLDFKVPAGVLLSAV